MWEFWEWWVLSITVSISAFPRFSMKWESSIKWESKAGSTDAFLGAQGDSWDTQVTQKGTVKPSFATSCFFL